MIKRTSYCRERITWEARLWNQHASASFAASGLPGCRSPNRRSVVIPTRR
jgi:hypothetical protein